MTTCPLCGATFDPSRSTACRSCPLGAGCRMTCCPACGYGWIEPEQTRAGRLLGRWLRGTKDPDRERTGAGSMTLAEVPVGWRARLFHWEATPPRRRQQLRAYGLAERIWMDVLQHTPATIIRVEQTELALEPELAATIFVDSARPADTATDRTPAPG